MNERLDAIVQRLGTGRAPEIGPLSTGERAYVALAAGRYDLLPRAYADPIEAWHRLAPEWRRAVCARRGWPREWGHG
mgnify:FL=1